MKAVLIVSLWPLLSSISVAAPAPPSFFEATVAKLKASPLTYQDRIKGEGPSVCIFENQEVVWKLDYCDDVNAAGGEHVVGESYPIAGEIRVKATNLGVKYYVEGGYPSIDAVHYRDLEQVYKEGAVSESQVACFWNEPLAVNETAEDRSKRLNAPACAALTERDHELLSDVTKFAPLVESLDRMGQAAYKRTRTETPVTTHQWSISTLQGQKVASIRPYFNGTLNIACDKNPDHSRGLKISFQATNDSAKLRGERFGSISDFIGKFGPHRSPGREEYLNAGIDGWLNPVIHGTWDYDPSTQILSFTSDSGADIDGLMASFFRANPSHHNGSMNPVWREQDGDSAESLFFFPLAGARQALVQAGCLDK